MDESAASAHVHLPRIAPSTPENCDWKAVRDEWPTYEDQFIDLPELGSFKFSRAMSIFKE